MAFRFLNPLFTPNLQFLQDESYAEVEAAIKRSRDAIVRGDDLRQAYGQAKKKRFEAGKNCEA